MRQRLYFTLPDVESAKQTVNDLLLARIEERYIHVVAKDDISLEGLHEASIIEKSDIVHGAEVGLIIGGLVGLVAGIIVLISPPEGISLKLVTVLITALIGAAFGAWVSSMKASSIPNSRLKAFEDEIAAGRILMMVDVPRTRVETVQEVILARHPEAIARGREATVPAFP